LDQQATQKNQELLINAVQHSETAKTLKNNADGKTMIR
jgi:hypothetical protein